MENNISLDGLMGAAFVYSLFFCGILYIGYAMWEGIYESTDLFLSKEKKMWMNI